ncbi:LuxR C-terminal-related transcriptional regulator [Streptomyces sp. NPDC052687]|uniref:LuxR C-terminal-related transcriptional regulator n=1 Tax=Streptomyces sp. NPDC052687 TaxID=3154759 RepID=UPI003426A5D5
MTYEQHAKTLRLPWPFTGRDEELELVRRSQAAGRPGIVVTGPAGVGKTRLVTEAVRGTDCARATGTPESRGIPFAAFAHLLPESVTLHRAVRLLSGVRLLVVDDAHLLDDASAALVHQLAVHGRTRLVVVVTDGAPAPAAIARLRTGELLPRLGLAPLPAEETAQLVAAGAGRALEPLTVRRLHRLCRGDLRLLRELLDAVRDGGLLSPVPDSGTWAWRGPVPVTPAVREHTAPVLDRTDPDERETLDRLAFAEPLAADSGTFDLRVLERLEAAGLIHLDERHHVRLAHPLHGPVLRATAGRLRARRLAGTPDRYAAALAAEAATLTRRIAAADVRALPAPVGEWLAAENHPVPPGYAAVRARYARLRGELTEAAAWAREGLRTAADDPACRGELALALAQSGDPAAARNAAGGRTAPGPVSAGPAAASGLEETADAGWDVTGDGVLGDGAPGGGVLRDGVSGGGVAGGGARGGGVPGGGVPGAGLPGGDVLRDGVPGDRVPGGGLLRDGVSGGGVAGGGARGGGVPGGGVPGAGLPGGDVLRDGVPGDRVPGGGLLRDGVSGGGVSGRGVPGDGALRGEVTGGGVLRDAVPSSGVPGGSVPGGGVPGGGVLGDGALGGGFPGDGASNDGALGGGVPSGGAPGGGALGGGFPGDGASSDGALGGGVPSGGAPGDGVLGDGAPGGGVPSGGAPGDRVLGDDAPGRGVPGGVPRDDAPSDRAPGGNAPSGGIPGDDVLALYEAVRRGDPGPVLGRLPAGSVFAEHAAALARRDGPALDRVAARLEERGLLLFAAEAYAQAVSAHRDPSAARTARTRAVGLARRCPGARTPALSGLVLGELTARQRQIVTLAAAGLSNRQIAERLTLSVRTVGNHLYSAYARLGASDRGALPWLVQLPEARSA